LRPDFLTFPASEGEEQPMRWIQLWRASEIQARLGELQIWLGRRAALIDLTGMIRSLDKALAEKAEGRVP
jgi:hypothetical protein